MRRTKDGRTIREDPATGMRLQTRGVAIEIALAVAIALGPLMRPPKLN
jgi:hypothetical protein